MGWKFSDKEFRREFCMFAGLLVSGLSLVVATANFAHGMGWLPASNASVLKDPSIWRSIFSPASIPVFISALAMLTTGFLFYKGRPSIANHKPPNGKPNTVIAAPKLVIHYAGWGRGPETNAYEDVTTTMLGFVRGNAVRGIKASDIFFGHHYGGEPRRLRVDYSFGDLIVKKTAVFAENMSVIIPEEEELSGMTTSAYHSLPTTVSISPGGSEKAREATLTVHSAEWIAKTSGASRRVEDFIRKEISETLIDGIRLRLVNDNLGGDPAPHTHKILKLSYSYGDAPPRHIVRNEYESLILPELPTDEEARTLTALTGRLQKSEQECGSLAEQLKACEKERARYYTESIDLKKQLEEPALTPAILRIEAFEKPSTEPVGPVARLVVETNSKVVLRLNVAVSNSGRVESVAAAWGVSLLESPNGRRIGSLPPTDVSASLSNPIRYGFPCSGWIECWIDNADAQSIARTYVEVTVVDGTQKSSTSEARMIYRLSRLPEDFEFKRDPQSSGATE